MSVDRTFRSLAAILGGRVVRTDDEAFIERHGGTPDDVVGRERSREHWARELLTRIQKN